MEQQMYQFTTTGAQRGKAARKGARRGASAQPAAGRVSVRPAHPAYNSGLKKRAKRRRRARRMRRIQVCLALAVLALGALVLARALPDQTVQAVGAVDEEGGTAQTAVGMESQYAPTTDTVDEPVDADGRTQPLVGVTPSEGPPYTVALDAGHGGDDVGASGAVDEVTMTEATVAALYALLESDPNFTPVLCRAYGEGATSTERAQVAAQTGAHVLVSVHGNSDASASTYGFECYAQLPGRANNAESLRLGRSIAAAIGALGQRLRGEGGVRYIYYTGSDAAGWVKQVAEQSDTTVRDEETFGLLEKSPCPAILIEQCFLTNSADASAWASSAGCAKAARAYYEGLCAYFGVESCA